jgi:Tol biopolymer transport system component
MSSGSETERPLPATPGDRVSKYEILSVLGQGGMGIVFRARDCELHREVALKCPWPVHAADPVLRKRFVREARASSKLSHPNIVPILDGFEANGLPWIAFQLVEGTDLRSVLTEKGRLPASTIIQYSYEIAQALSMAHSKGILHRDVNPRNILVGKDGRVLLTDFGLARALPDADSETTSSSTDGTSLTEHGSIVGTLRYMSPEQALGKTVDARSDLFSFGAVIYEMCTGRHAFDGAKFGEILDAIMHREPEPISRFSYEIPEELERIVRKLLAKDTEERYQSAPDLLADLRPLRRTLESQSIPRPPLSRTPTRKRMLAIAAMAVGAAAIVLLLVWKTHSPSRREFRLGNPIQVTSSPAWETDPAISPDGTRLAYASNENGQREIYVIGSRGGMPLRLTDHVADDASPVWFRDGSAIAFVSNRSGTEAIWKVGQMGGDATLLVPDAFSPAFSTDGQWIAFTRQDSTGFESIAVAPLENVSNVRLLTGRTISATDQGPGPHTDAAWSPNGTEIAFSGWDDLWIVSTKGGIPQRLTEGGVRDQEPAWSPDGRTIYFASYREGKSALWRVDRRTRSIDRLSAGTGQESKPSVAADGSRLAYCTHSADADENDIVLLDRASGEEIVLPGENDDLMPALSPDETFLVFSSNRLGSKYDLWKQRLEQRRPVGTPERITDQPGNASRPAISPDGRRIAYYRADSDSRSLWCIPAEGGLPVQLGNQANSSISPSWSPDSQRIAFLAISPEGPHLWIAEIGEGSFKGSARQICNEKLTSSRPTWSADGRSIAVVRDSGKDSEAWIVPADGAQPGHSLTKGAQALEVRATENAYAVCGWWGGDHVECRFVDPVNGTVFEDKPAVDFKGPIPVYAFDISRDGNLIAFARDRPYGDLWVLEGPKGSY